MTLHEQPLSDFLQDLLLEAAPARPVREFTPPSPAPRPVAQTPDNVVELHPRVKPSPRCPVCGEFVNWKLRATRFVDGIEYHRVCLGDGGDGQ